MILDPERAPVAGQRGPADHVLRQQIVTAASVHFSRYGYAKTRVADLAKVVGFSKAYIYKFFDSKQALGEAICSQRQTEIIASAREAVRQGKTAADKYRRLFRSIVTMSAALFFDDKMLHDIAAHSAKERWPSSVEYAEAVYDLLVEVVLFGRETGEFERKTPLDETCQAILQVMQPFMNPLMLEHNLYRLPEAPCEVANLVLRSLAP